MKLMSDHGIVENTTRGPSSRPRGFTLIESVIAMAVFAFVLAGLAMLTLSTMRTNSSAKHYGEAGALAQALIEDLRAASFASVVSSSAPEAVAADGATTGNVMFTRSWVVLNGSPSAAAKTVTVTVSWHDVEGAHDVRMQTILAN